MSDTAGNQTVAIVTNKTPHVTTPLAIPSKDAVQNAPTKTTVADEDVFTEGGLLQNDGTAEPVSFSSDVKMEGKFVCRTGDKTKQEKDGDTEVGPTDGGEVEPVVEEKQAKAGDTCSLTNLVGEHVSVDGRGNSVTRRLGVPRGGKKGDKENYIEALDNRAFKFKIEWVNTLEPEKGGVCTQGKNHPLWKAESKYEDEVKTHEASGIEMELPPDIVHFKGLENKSTTTAGSIGQKKGDKILDSRGTNRHGEARGRSKAMPVTPLDAVEIIKIVAFMWKVHGSPGVCDVDVASCAGTESAKIMIMPRNKFTANLDFEFLGQILRNKFYKPLEWVVKLVNWTGGNVALPDKNTRRVSSSTADSTPTKLARERVRAGTARKYQRDRVAGYKKGGLDYDLRFCDGLRMAFKIKYVELTADKNGHTHVECNKNWALEFEAEKFLYINLFLNVPITTFLGVVGKAVGILASVMDVEEKVGIYLIVGIDPVFRIEYDEYEEWQARGRIQLDFEFGLKFVLKWKSNSLVLTGGYFGRISADRFEADQKRDILIGCDVIGSLSFNVSGSYDVSFLGWRKSGGFGWYPAWGKYAIPKKFYPLVKVQ